MGISLAEIVLVIGVIAGIYKVLTPLRVRIEAWMLDRLIPGRRRIIDVKSEKE